MENDKEIETAIATWGMMEAPEFTPPDEVVDAVLERPEIELEYPEVYQQALEIKKLRSGAAGAKKQNQNQNRKGGE